VIDKELLQILACPETHQPLAEAGADLIAKVNAAVGEGRCKNRGGQSVTESLSGGLLRQDEKVLYPVREGIPVLLVDEGIEIEGL
jgi:uncharacterized protein YbaR (Trm112 family)